jgi:hypothetical protein
MPRLQAGLQLGGMNRVGDSARQPAFSTRKSINTVIRPGPRVDARSGFIFETQSVTAFDTVTRLVPYPKQLLAIKNSSLSGATSTLVRTTFGWADTAVTANSSANGGDFTQAFGGTFGLFDYNVGTVPVSGVYKYDGNITINPTITPVWGSAIRSAIRRLFVGAPNFTILSNLSAADSLDFTGWTLAATVRTSVASGTETSTKMVFTGAGTITSPLMPILDANRAAWVTWQQAFLADDNVTAPFTMEVLDAAGNTLTTRKIILPAKNGEWQRYGLSALVPANTQYKVRLTAGTAEVAALATTTIRVGFYLSGAPGSENKGALVTSGRYFYTANGMPIMPYNAFNPLPIEFFNTRIIWCETDDITWWRAENFWDLTEAPGTITALAVGGGYLAAFKDLGLWLFALTDNADAPLSFADFNPSIGCFGTKAIRNALGSVFWIDKNNVWRWNFSGEPEPLVSAEMREYLFNQSTINPAARILLEVMTDTKEVVVQIMNQKQHVLNLETGQWTEWIVGNAAGVNLDDMFYQDAGTGKRELYATFNSGISRLDINSATDQFNAGFTPYVVTPEQWLHTIESPEPRQYVTVEKVTLDHLITASTTITPSVSLDNGLNFAALPVATISAGNLAKNADSEQTPIPIRKTAKRMIVKLQGQGPASKFSLVGAVADLIFRGKARDVNPGA